MKNVFSNTTVTPNETWLNGEWIIDSQTVEINTSLSTFSVFGYRYDFFAQGESANETILEIHAHWIANNCTQSESIAWWIDTYL